MACRGRGTLESYARMGHSLDDITNGLGARLDALGDIVDFFLRQFVAVVRQNLSESADDIEWRAYLVRQVLDIGRLLLVGLNLLLIGACQFFIPLFQFVGIHPDARH